MLSNLAIVAILIAGNLVILFPDKVPDKGYLLAIINLLVFLLILFTKREKGGARRELRALRKEYERLNLSFDTSDREGQVLHTLAEISETFAGELANLDAVLGRVLESIQNVLSIDISVIQLYAMGEPIPSSEIFRGAKVINIDREVYEKVILRGSSILINDLSPLHSEYKRYRELCEQGFKALLVAPLKVRGNIVGLLGAFSAAEHDFTGEELRLLTTFANQAALIVENARLLEMTRRLSITDEMTGLYNYRHFREEFEKEFHRAYRYKHELSLLMCDVDHFKNYNDTHGHPAGDLVLRSVGKILKTSIRPTDLTARYGGEEFVIILTETGKENAQVFADRLRKKIEDTPFRNEETQPLGRVTISIGFSSFPPDANSAAELISCSDQALYKSKELGRNRVSSFRAE